MPSILIVEDEKAIAENIIYALKTEGYKTWHCKNAQETRTLLKDKQPDLILLDVGLPDESGFELAKSIIAISNIPIIFVTARADEVDRIIGLEIGGDDYVVKPFSPRELTARIKALLRRANTNSDNKAATLQYGPFTITADKLKVQLADQYIEFSRYEYKIFKLLIDNPGRVFSRDMIMNRIWEDPDMSLERTVDAHIKSIRQKIRAVTNDVEYITTHRGVGYSFRELPS